MKILSFFSFKRVLFNQIVLGVVFFFSLNTQSYALPQCPKLMTQFLTKSADLKKAPPSFDHWSPKDFAKVTPAHFLPQNYIEEIEKKLGPIQMTVEKNFEQKRNIFSLFGNQTPSSWKMTIHAKNQDPFITCFFIISPRDDQHIFLTGLELLDPLPNLRNLRTHLSQDGKGLPFGVFQHLKRQLIFFLKAGGFNKIKATPQTYLVSKLYRKMLGFRPMNQKAVETYRMLDELYKNSRPSFEEMKRLTPMEIFSRSLGDHRINNAERPFDEVLKIEQELRENPAQFFEKNLPLYSPVDRRLVGVIYQSYNEKKIYYFLEDSVPLKIINWKDLLESYSLSLELDI